MLFGEIVEPSTRALLGDDETQTFKDLQWVIPLEVQSNVNNLLISETRFANDLLKGCLLENLEPIGKTTKNEITIYKKNDDIVILCNLIDEIAIGDMTEAIIPWVENSQQTFTLTTAPQATFQKEIIDFPIVLMRSLSTKNSTIVPILETPNIVSGLGAGILSFCKHTNRKCDLFIGYINCEPLDSLNSKPFIDLLHKINIPPVKNYVLKEQLPSHNLYM